LKANNDIYFYHLGARDGLSQVNIMSIYQDEFGAMWFGSTEGLNRYNGREVEVFRPSQDRVGLSQNTIYQIYGNKAGAIYLRNGRDLARYDVYTQQFESIQQGNVHAISYQHNTLWIALGNRIMLYDEQHRQLEEYLSLNNDIPLITAILPAKNETIWIGTLQGLFAISKEKPENQKPIIENIYITTIYQDNNENIWVGTVENGVYRINSSGNIVNYRHQFGVNSISNNQIRDFVEDNAGNIWVATFYGLNMFNPQTGEWTQSINNDNISHSLSHSSVFSLYKDKQGTIWVGTYFGGVNYFNPDADIFRFYEPKSNLSNHLSFPFVGNMTEDKHGNLWVCTEGGALNRLNLQTRQFTRYTLNKSDEGYNQKAIWYRADKDLLYIGTHNEGLIIFDIKTKTARILTRNEAPNSLPNNIINEMQFYDGSLYLMTQSGFVRMDIDTEEFFPMSENPAVRGIGRGTFYIDSKSRLWGTISAGVRKIDLKTGDSKDYNYDSENDRSIGRFSVMNIFETDKGELFFATLGSGIFRYNPLSDDFDSFTEEKDGLLSNYCYYISQAPSGKLILLHNKGFAFFNPENPSENLFRSSSAFPVAGFNNGNTAYVTRDEEIFIGGINGLVSFMESDLDKIYKDYNLFFDKLFINNERVFPGDRFDVLQKTLPLYSRIELKHSQNNITIEFATSNFVRAMTPTFEYKLEGFDKVWLPAETKMISYTNLNTGTYTLHVREISSASEGDRKEISLIIRIKPPFYLTTVAFIIYTGLAILLIIGILRFYLWRTNLKATLEFERKEKERIEELNQTKLSFFTNVSHEFRTPLTLIIGQLETLLIQNDLTLKMQNRLMKIHKNTNHLQTLISELLDFQKQELGFQKLSIRSVELVSYLKEIYDSFQDYAANKRIKYKMDYLDEEIFVYIDSLHFRKAIYNLLSNAFKYTASGGEIKLKVRRKESEVFIQVIDTGVGIPPESTSKIFDRFYQLEYRSSGLTLGTGIGLALTKEIVMSHKGKISVESTPNEGSIFTIALQTGIAHFTNEELNYKEIDINTGLKKNDIRVFNDDEDLILIEEKIENVEGEKPVVVLVDDNEALLETLTEPLSAYYNIYTATNGREGLDLVYKLHPDLLISDVVMPEMSGKELCYRLKNNVITSHIPIVLLTAQAIDSQIVDGYLFGADAYITKPFNMKVLISQCNNLIKNRQLLYKKFANQAESVTFSNAVVEQDQVLINKTIKIIKENFKNADFDMNQLAVKIGVGRSKLYSKIKEATGFTPNELTLNIKLQEAADLLDNNLGMNISEIAFELGFSSSKYFTKCFKAFYGMAPMDWRKRDRNNTPSV
jgi:signal transduction histidine kinase/ligand-binding sensor domain-containing protein/DNA-binding response OmpR family regulator